MNIAFPAQLKKTISRNMVNLGISKREYVLNALAHYNQLVALDAQLNEEMQMWDDASMHDLHAFNVKHNL